MAKKQTPGARGPRGPAGPSGERGVRGERGQRGARGTKGPAGALGPDAEPEHLIKALDTQVEGIYRELSNQLNQLARLQSQLDEVRAVIRRLGARAQQPST